VYIVAGTASQKAPCRTRHTTLTEPPHKAIKQGHRTTLAKILSVLDKVFQADMLNQETLPDCATLQTIAQRAEEEQNESQNPWTWTAL